MAKTVKQLWIEVFRAGTHTDSSGNTRNWTRADLEQIAASYNPVKHEAPVVLGHPEDNAPAYGWVKALAVKGDLLLAELGELEPGFVEMWQAGRFKKRSISLNPDLTLRHVGFLGAVPPAVKGLKDAKFQGGAAGAAQTLEFNHPGFKDIAMKEYFVLADGRIYCLKEQKIVSKDDADYQAWLAQGNQPEGQKAEGEPGEHAQPNKPQPPAGQPVAGPATAPVNHAQPQDKSESEKALELRLAEVERQARLDKAQGFSEGLIRDGRLTAAEVKQLPEFLASLGEAAEISFSEGKKKPDQWLRDFLSALPKRGHMTQLGQGRTADHAEEVRAAYEIAGLEYKPQK